MQYMRNLGPAIPMFVMAAMFLNLGINPDARFPIPATSMGVIMAVEAAVLFFSLFVTGISAESDGRFKKLLKIYCFALLFVGAYAFLGKSWAFFIWFWVLILLHQWSVLRCSHDALVWQSLLIWSGIGIYALTAFIAFNITVPRYPERYPDIGRGVLAFKTHGLQFVYWGIIHFALLGLITPLFQRGQSDH